MTSDGALPFSRSLWFILFHHQGWVKGLSSKSRLIRDRAFSANFWNRLFSRDVRGKPPYYLCVDEEIIAAFVLARDIAACLSLLHRVIRGDLSFVPFLLKERMI
jgi:hypothetical protein